MNKQEKVQEVERLSEALKSGPPTFLVKQHGLTVNQVSALRKKVRETSSSYRVIKNRLALRAIKKTPLEGLSACLTGPTAIAYGASEPAALAKVLQDFAKQNKGLELKGGFVDGRVVDAAEVKALAELPPRPILMARFIGVLNAPMSRLVTVLKAPVRDLALVMDAIAKKKEAGGDAAAETSKEA